MSQYNQGYYDGIVMSQIYRDTSKDLFNAITLPARRRAEKAARQKRQEEAFEQELDERGLIDDARIAEWGRKQTSRLLQKSEAQLVQAENEIAALKQSVQQLSDQNVILKKTASRIHNQSIKEAGEDAAFLTYIDILETLVGGVVRKRLDPDAEGGDIRCLRDVTDFLQRNEEAIAYRLERHIRWTAPLMLTDAQWKRIKQYAQRQLKLQLAQLPKKTFALIDEDRIDYRKTPFGFKNFITDRSIEK